MVSSFSAPGNKSFISSAMYVGAAAPSWSRFLEIEGVLALDYGNAMGSLFRSLGWLLLSDTAIDVLGRIAGPHVAIVVGHSTSAFRHRHVAVEDRGLGGHTDRRTGIRNSLG